VMVATGLVGAVAAPASAQTEYHFKVFEKQKFLGVPDNPEPGDRFRYKGKMFDPQDRDNRVGSDRGKCKLKRNGTFCEGTTHLDGQIGGLGDIEYRGTATERHPGFKVVGGTDDFEGATGEVGFRNLNEKQTKIMTKWDLVVP
jgi:ribosomal protein L27